MAYVIAEPCVGVCENECVSSCPVDCIHGPPEATAAGSGEGARQVEGLQLYIDPDECTSCSACESACPVGAVFEEDSLPPEWLEYRAKNANFFARGC